MKPFVLTLPDHVRDVMDARLSAASHATNAQKIGDVLFGKDTVNPEFSNQLREALLAMQTGHGALAVQLDNLPRANSEAFVSGLCALIHGDMRKPGYTLKRNGAHQGIGFHQDSPYVPDAGHKMIRMLYVKTPGARPDPTIFITADEVIEALTCHKLGLPLTSPEAAHNAAYAATRQTIVDALMQVHVFASPIMDDHLEMQPFLQRNPHAGAAGSAEFFICATRHNERHMNTNEDVMREFYAMAETLREHAQQQSTASMHPHSAVFWNDSGVLHDRAGAVQAERTLLTSCARPKTFAERYDPTTRFAGGPAVAV